MARELEARPSLFGRSPYLRLWTLDPPNPSYRDVDDLAPEARPALPACLPPLAPPSTETAEGKTQSGRAKLSDILDDLEELEGRGSINRKR